jgi:flagellar biosynthetic protein FliR
MIVLQEDFVMGKLADFFLLSIRLSALFLAAPILSASAVSLPIRIALTLGITVVLAGVVPVPKVDIASPAGVMMIFGEALIGLTIGLIFQLAFAALAIAGEQMAASMGLGFAAMVDPQSGSQSQVITQFLTILMTLIFLVVGGHHVMLRHLADSYQVLPIGGPIDTAMMMGVVRAASLMFSAALIIALPILILLFLVNILIGLMTRVSPQMNIFSVGFPFTILVGFTVLLVSLPTVANGMTNLISTVSDVARDLILTERPQP